MVMEKTIRCLVFVLILTALISAFALASASVAINAAYFPDPNFRAFVSTYDNGDGVLTDYEISFIRDINCQSSKIKSLQGINYLTSLEELKCGYNELTELNITGCPKLVVLYCERNQIQNLQLTSCPALEFLECGSNKLESLDISKNTALLSLDCSNNNLTSLNVSRCKKLNYLKCSANKIRDLVLSGNTKLRTLA